MLNKHLVTGHKKVSSALNSFWTDFEAMREAQRKRNEERAQTSSTESPPLGNESGSPVISPRASTSNAPSPSSSWFFARRNQTSADHTNTQAPANSAVSTASQRAGAYLSSWGTWAAERRKEWQEKRTDSDSTTPSIASPSTTTITSQPEKAETDRGRISLQLSRQNSTASKISRSLSRKKRWSSILRKKEDHESELNFESGVEIVTVPSRSPTVASINNSQSELSPTDSQGQDAVPTTIDSNARSIPPSEESISKIEVPTGPAPTAEGSTQLSPGDRTETKPAGMARDSHLSPSEHSDIPQGKPEVSVHEDTTNQTIELTSEK